MHHGSLHGALQRSSFSRQSTCCICPAPRAHHGTIHYHHQQQELRQARDLQWQLQCISTHGTPATATATSTYSVWQSSSRRMHAALCTSSTNNSSSISTSRACHHHASSRRARPTALSAAAGAAAGGVKEAGELNPFDSPSDDVNDGDDESYDMGVTCAPAFVTVDQASPHYTAFNIDVSLLFCEFALPSGLLRQ